MQQTFYDFSAFEMLENRKPLLVCDPAFDIALPCSFVRFRDFHANPRYEDVETGIEMLLKNKCDFLVAIGGGSCMDVAKGIKYYGSVDFPILAVPTTSGTGSEATHFAVIYVDGEKHSIADPKILPDYVILQPDMLRTLPVYQKKCTMLDALCQAIESWWSPTATAESIAYSREAIGLILDSMEPYLRNQENGNRNMLIASNLAGKAINITATTAPHAMSYKLTSLFGLPHGHAVAICLPKVWRYMGCFDEIARALGQKDAGDAVVFLEDLLQRLDIRPPKDVTLEDIDILTDSVNTQRLRNSPVWLAPEMIRELYKEILEV